MAIVQETLPCSTSTFTGTLAAVRVLPHWLTVVLVWPPAAGRTSCVDFAAELQPATRITATVASAGRPTWPLQRTTALPVGQRACMVGLLSAPLIMPSVAWPGKTDSPKQAADRAEARLHNKSLNCIIIHN